MTAPFPTNVNIPDQVSGHYTTGQAHGKTIASAHPSAHPTLLIQAQAAAQADTNRTLQALRAQQQQIIQQAQMRAHQLNLASGAAANLEKGIAGQTLGTYRTGAQDLIGFANGYTGDLRDTASQAAQTVSNGLRAVGAPNSTVPAAAQASDLGNVLYGLGGQLPASVMLTSGLAQAAAQRQLLATTRGIGLQYAQGALGQGTQASNQVLSQIQQTIAQQPGLVQNYLAQYQKAQADAQQQAVDNYYKQQELQISQQNADTSRYSATKPSSSRSGSAGLTPSSQSSLVKKVSDDVSSWATGDKGQISTHWVTDPDTGKVSLASSPIPGTSTDALTYGQALARAIAEGPSTAGWARKAKQIVDAQYPPGTNGRPYSMGQYRAGAPKFAHDAFYGGADHPPLNYNQAVQLAQQSGYPPSVIVPVLNRVYHRGAVTAIPVGPK